MNDIDRINRNIEKAYGKAFLRIAEAMEFCVKLVENEAKKTTAFIDRTGDLRRSIQGEVAKITGEMVEGHISSSLSYAAPVELGAKPHIIRPRTKKYLHFPIKEGGSPGMAGMIKGWVKTKEVHHPGIKPHPFLFPALEAKKNEVNRIMMKMIREVF